MKAEKTNENGGIVAIRRLLVSMILLSLLRVGNITYLLSPIMLKLFEEYYIKKLDTKYEIKIKILSIMVLFIYLVEQYFILNYSDKIYGIVCFLLIGLYIIYYFQGDFKLELNNKKIWIDFLVIIAALYIFRVVYFKDYFNNVAWLMIPSVIILFVNIFSSFNNLNRIQRNVYNEIRNSLYRNLLLYNIYSFIWIFFERYNWINYPQNFLILIKCCCVLIMLNILIELNRMFNILKEIKLINDQDKIKCTYYLIIFIYCVIKILTKIIMYYHFDILNIL